MSDPLVDLRAQIAAIESGDAQSPSVGEISEDADRIAKKLRLRLQRRAHYCLSQRDYSRAELAQKLLDRPLYKANSNKAQFKRYVEAQRAEQALRWGSIDEASDSATADVDVLPVAPSAMDAPKASDAGEALPEEPPAEQVADWVESLLNELERDGYLSDARYCESYVRSKYNAGQGPSKITHKLRQNAVDSGLIQAHMEQYDWYERAKEVRVQKYGTLPPDDYQQRAKQMRFLQSRGFDSDQCHYATGS